MSGGNSYSCGVRFQGEDSANSTAVILEGNEGMEPSDNPSTHIPPFPMNNLGIIHGYTLNLPFHQVP